MQFSISVFLLFNFGNYVNGGMLYLLSVLLWVKIYNETLLYAIHWNLNLAEAS